MNHLARLAPVWVAIILLTALPLRAQDLDVPRTRTFPGIDNLVFPYAEPEEVGLSSTALRELGGAVAQWVADGQIVGAEVMVVKDRQIVMHEAIGWSDREGDQPLERNSIFRLLAMTKPFTGTAAMMLIDDGAFELDAPVSRWLPSWANERSGDITVRHLLTHTGGFEQYGTPRPIQSYRSLRAAVDDAGEKGPEHRPGAAARYSDVHSYALGALVAEVAGIPIEQFIQERILDPLGLDDTYTGFAPDSVWADRVNARYQFIDGTWKKVWTPDQQQADPFFRASGGLFSTVSDYARWLDAWMVWANRASVSRADSDRPRPDEGTIPQLLSEEMIRVALSPPLFHWETGSVDPLVFGHGGVDGTHGMAIPSLGISVIYLTQSQGRELRPKWTKAARNAVAPNVEFHRPIASVPADQAGLRVTERPRFENEVYAGSYTAAVASVRIFLEEGRLHRTLPVAGEPRVTLVPLEEKHTFAMGRYDGNRLVEVVLPLQRLRFVVDEGRSVALELIHDGKVGAVLRRADRDP